MPQQIDLYLNAKAQEAARSESFVVGFRNAKDDEPAEILIDGIIGDSYDANDSRSVTQFLRANKGKAVRVWINSPGGSAYDGITMHNALMAHDAPVTTIIAGMAGSAASIIAMAGNPIQIYESANLFIHRASLMAFGNVDVMADAQDWLSKIDESIVRLYRGRTGLPLDQIRKLMKGKVDGTVFTATEAKSGKWVDEVISTSQAKAKNTAGLNARLSEAFCASLGAGRFTSKCSCTGETKRAVVAYGSKLADARLHSTLCPVRAEFDAGCGEFSDRNAGLDEHQVTQLIVRLRGSVAAKNLEASRAERIRSRRELFVPAE